MTNQGKLTRRHFLATAASAATIPYLVPGSVLGLDGKLPANERVRNVIIGYGNRGTALTRFTLASKQYQVVGMCDCYEPAMMRGIEHVNGHYKNKDCRRFARYEDILECKDVDVIMNAAPDHWHTKITVDACKAGKDVYCEKPLTLTPIESRQIVQAARKYNRIVSGGSQRVMEDYGGMAPVVQSGYFGEVKEAHVLCGPPPSECFAPEQKVPAGLDWDRWLGQAPWVPYSSWRCSGSYGGGWRNWLEYGNGFIADWGCHRFAATMYWMGMDTEEPVTLVPPHCDENDTDGVLAIFANGFKLYHVQGGPEMILIGTERVLTWGQERGLKPLKPVEVRRYKGGQRHLWDEYAWCVRHRARPFQDVVYGAAAATICQLMVLCYRLNRRLNWDRETCTFKNDEAASRLVRRVQRAPYQITLD